MREVVRMRAARRAKDDSIYRYDRAALLGALTARRRDARHG